MKKFSIVASLVALTVFTLSGCSSAEISASDMPAETSADGAALTALTDPDAAASASSEVVSSEPSASAMVDTAGQAATVADNSSYTPPVERSPVNLGASSAGRAH